MTDVPPAAASELASVPLRARRRGFGSVRGFLMAMPPILLIALFIGFPIVMAALYSFGYTGFLNSIVARGATHQHTNPNGGLTLGAYADVFADQRFRQDLVATIVVTLVTTLVVIAVALGIALYLRLSQSWAAKLLTVFAVIPQFIPVVIASWALLMFYAPDGFLRSVFAQLHLAGAPSFSNTVPGIIIAQVWCSLPFAVLMCTSGVQAVPDSLIDAARDSGASLWRATVDVILPTAMVPIIIAATFTAIGVLGSFTVPYFMGPNVPTMLGVDMSAYFTNYAEPQQSIVMAVVVFLIASGIAALYVWANFHSTQEQEASR